MAAYYELSGRITNRQGQPLANLTVHAYDRDPVSADDKLGEAKTDALGMYVIRFTDESFHVGGREHGGPDLFIIVFDGDKRLGQSPYYNDAGTQTVINLSLDYVPPESRTTGVLEGRILLDNGMPAKQMKVYVYRRGIGGETTLVGETSTENDGTYSLPYDLPGRVTGLEVRTKTSRGEEVPLSKPIFRLNDRDRTTVNLIAPQSLQPLAAEYRRLLQDVTPHIGSLQKLMQESGEQRQLDLALLHHATGWDARLIALSGAAEQISAESGALLSQEAVYGLLRAGLPSDKLMLAQVEPDVAEQALLTVRDSGIVDLSDAQIAQFKSRFAAFADKTRLSAEIPGSRATYGQLLDASGLTETEKNRFASVYLNHRGEPAAMWEKARQAGLGEEQISKLQLQGKLAYLTGNSEAVTTRLMQNEIREPAKLAELGYFRIETWKQELKTMAGDDNGTLESLIPPSYAGESLEERLQAYAEDMARKVRLSYPTHVVRKLIEEDEIKLDGEREATLKLLGAAANRGFRLGQTPVTSFLKTHRGVTEGLSEHELRAAEHQLKSLQRVYQITPSNEAMAVLCSLQMTSAYDVTGYDEEWFTARFNARYAELYHAQPPTGEARLVYRKAKQVTSVAYNLFAAVQRAESDPPIRGISAPPEVRERVRNELVKQFPTMESLFGSVDFCECEHCRSVLSPAAYLVDLLQFIDAEPEMWDHFLANWEKEHGTRYSDFYMKPYDALISRRPDLPHIPLTCENTNTALPYIDLVNEILEYWVAYGKLSGEAARDTGDVPAEELLAEPHYVIREAYDKLLEARYPLQLPFDLWIETARRLCSQSDTTLADHLALFAQQDRLFAPDQPVDLCRVFMESLELSPAEAALFADPDPLASWYEWYGFASEAEALTPATDAESGQRIDLNSAKSLAGRLNVSYKELTEIVQTEFVNPMLTKCAILQQLGAGVADVRNYLADKPLLAASPDSLSAEELERRLEAESFRQKLSRLAAHFGLPLPELEQEIEAIDLSALLVLADPNAGCDFDRTTLQYADGSKADALTFLRIQLFVRLWRKLGWTIKETDRALKVFIPANAPFEAGQLAKRPLLTALIYIAHLNELSAKLSGVKENRLKLTALWSDIDTAGKNSLYAQLFLTRSVLNSDPVFERLTLPYVPAEDRPLADHLTVLQGTLGLTADEVTGILEEAGMTPGEAKLSLSAISLLYRYGLLAKGLDLTVGELISLKRLSGLDPFKPLDPEPLSDLDADYPLTQTLKFVEAALTLREIGFRAGELAYAFGYGSEDAGWIRESALPSLKTLADGIRAIRAEHAVPDDPGAWTDEHLRQKLGLALPGDIADRLLSMMNGTAEFTAVKSSVPPEKQLNPADFTEAAPVVEVRYNAVRQEQKLTFRGVLFDQDKAQWKTRFPSEVFGDLLDDVQKQAVQFFERYLKKQPLNQGVSTGFLDDEDYELLFGRTLADGETKQERALKQRRRLAAAFLPFLQERLIRQYVIRTITAETGAAPDLAESLLTDERLLAAPGALADTFAAIGRRGISAAFFASADGSGEPLAMGIIPEADTGARDADGRFIRPEGASSARMEAYFAVPSSGPYRFYIELELQDTEAELKFDHLPNPVFLRGKAAVERDVLGGKEGEFLELRAGVLYRFTLTLRRWKGDARLLVQGETLPKSPLSQLTLYPADVMEAAARAKLKLSKALRLLETLRLNEREIRWFSTRSAALAGLNLSRLPAAEAEASADEASKLFGQLLRLAAYVRLRGEMAGGTDGLISVFEAQEAGNLSAVYARIARLTGHSETAVQEAAETLFAAPDFSSGRPLERLWGALQLAERFGVRAATLREWTRIADPKASAAQRFSIAQAWKEAVKGRMEPETWRKLAQPIFDALRRRQRDALSAYAMHKLGFRQPEQLYDYFLIDPGMEPAVQSSRIRLAIASVQLFIQRCLLNMEADVHPSAINAKTWEWMKRYRVWEANRKIFLYPENWLEPEFRDDKTHLFRDLEGTLLAGDVSAESAEDAFLNYLRKLDELARLDIIAAYLEDSGDPALRTLHVIGRTYGEPHKYYYRRYVHRMWTPWEPVSAEIEGDHIAPVVWRGRLYLFWVTFVEKPAEDAMSSGKLSGDMMSLTVGSVYSLVGTKQVEAHLHWSEYLGGEWGTRESAGGTSPITATVPQGFNPKSVFIHVSKAYENGDETGLFIHLGGAFNRSIYLAGRNSLPESRSYTANGKDGAKPKNPYSAAGEAATRYYGGRGLAVEFTRRMSADPKEKPQMETPSIFEKSGSFNLVTCNNPIVAGITGEGEDELASLMKPVFYQDDTYTLFMEPAVEERTIEEWQDWVTRTPRADPSWLVKDLWKEIAVVPYIPSIEPIEKLEDWMNKGYEAVIGKEPRVDWLTNEHTALILDGVLIGSTGQPVVHVAESEVLPTGNHTGDTIIKIPSGSGALPEVTARADTILQSGLRPVGGMIRAVGHSGWNTALQHSLVEERFMQRNSVAMGRMI